MLINELASCKHMATGEEERKMGNVLSRCEIRRNRANEEDGVSLPPSVHKTNGVACCAPLQLD